MNTLHNIIQVMIYVYNSLAKAREWFQLGLHERTSNYHINNLGKREIERG